LQAVLKAVDRLGSGHICRVGTRIGTLEALVDALAERLVVALVWTGDIASTEHLAPSRDAR
jgi:hypothetical protein